MKTEIKKILYKFLQDGITSDDAAQQVLDLFAVSGSVASSDVGKCTTCKFNDKEWDRCVAGTYWAEQGLDRICYEGELWEATEH